MIKTPYIERSMKHWILIRLVIFWYIISACNECFDLQQRGPFLYGKWLLIPSATSFSLAIPQMGQNTEKFHEYLIDGIRNNLTELMKCIIFEYYFVLKLWILRRRVHLNSISFNVRFSHQNLANELRDYGKLKLHERKV